MATISASMPRPKPHILVLSWSIAGEAREYLESLGDGVYFRENLHDVRESDFDFIIVYELHYSPTVFEIANVLHFSAEGDSINDVMGLGERLSDHLNPEQVEYEILRYPGSRAHEFDSIGISSDRELYEAVRDTLSPNLSRGGEYRTLRINKYGADTKHDPEETVLFSEKAGSSIASIYQFPGRAEVWAIPHEVSDRVRWIKLFLDRMKLKYPEKFPADETSLSYEYLTFSEISKKNEIEAYEARTQEIVEERERGMANLHAEYDAVSLNAESNERLILKANGETLVENVAKVLKSLGFEVEDRDEFALADRSAKQEDLRITHADACGENWVCIAEIKGAKGGAPAKGLTQIYKAAGVYEHMNDRGPNSLWYIVNHSINTAPQDRPAPLVSNPSEVASFAEEGGLVIDTRELFKLNRAVEMGEITKSVAAKSLVGSTGIYEARVVDGNMLD